MKFWSSKKNKLIISLLVLVVVAFALEDVAAVFVVVFGSAILTATHAIEFKFNRLLDERGIFVADFELKNDE